MNKRITIPIIIILALGAILLTFFIFRGEPETVRENETGSFPESSESDTDTRRETPSEEFGTGDDRSGQAQNLSEENPLLQIVDDPVAGYALFEKEIGTGTTEQYVRYTERGTGHVFEGKLPGGPFERISNTTIPKTRRALWSPEGDYVLIRYEDENDSETIKNFIAEIDEDQEEGLELSGNFLPENIGSPAFSPSGTELVYVEESADGSNILVYSLDADASSIIYSSPARDWTLGWVNPSTLLVYTKPSGEVPGFAYTLPSGGGLLSKLTGGFRGLLPTLSPNEEDLLITVSSGSNFNSFRVEGGQNTSLGVKMIPDKCAWSTEFIYCGVPKTVEGGLYPDSWYKGVQTFSDAFWKIDPRGDQTEVLNVPDESLDAVEVLVSKDNNYLVFKNKKDSSLWLLKLPEPATPADE